MCDYSLHNVATRPARVGDRLVVTKFRNTVTHGFGAIDQTNVAVCLLPGTELAFDREAECSHPFAKLLPGFGFGKIGERTARFRQVNLKTCNVHHDALEFANGTTVLITKLRLGQHATVLQLPIQANAAHDVQRAQVVVAHVNQEALIHGV